jgi:hypothetical protein
VVTVTGAGHDGTADPPSLTKVTTTSVWCQPLAFADGLTVAEIVERVR